jgi:hypothetical protein
LTTLQDDVASIGYYAFVGMNNPALASYSITSGTQEPFMILPAPRAVSLTGPNPANLGGALVTANLPTNPDELQYVSDLSLPIQATLVGTSPNGLTLKTLISGSLSDLQQGDVVAILDGAFEQFPILGPPVGPTVTWPTVPADLNSPLLNVKGGMYSLNAPGVNFHVAGTPLAFYRPSVVTRYSIQAQAWDPSNPAITIPCLVRQQTPYPPDGSLVNWANVPITVVAENIEGFNVDLSFDQGATWLRTGAANWDAIVANITTALAPLGTTGTPARNPNSPLWFRNYPFLIRMNIVSRSAAPRSESTTVVGQADYVRRTQTLLVTPRNLGFSL